MVHKYAIEQSQKKRKIAEVKKRRMDLLARLVRASEVFKTKKLLDLNKEKSRSEKSCESQNRGRYCQLVHSCSILLAASANGSLEVFRVGN